MQWILLSLSLSLICALSPSLSFKASLSECGLQNDLQSLIIFILFYFLTLQRNDLVEWREFWNWDQLLFILNSDFTWVILSHKITHWLHITHLSNTKSTCHSYIQFSSFCLILTSSQKFRISVFKTVKIRIRKKYVHVMCALILIISYDITRFVVIVLVYHTIHTFQV